MRITSKVVNQIIQKAKERGYNPKATVVLFYVKSLLVKYNHQKLTPSDVLQIIDEAVLQFCQATEDVGMRTVDMQVSVLRAREEFDAQEEEEERADEFKSKKLMDEILKKSDQAQVFGDIVLYILHQTGLLSSADHDIETETMTALESVIPRDFIDSFITQTEEKKENQLYDLWKIVWGIRLYNKESGQGGAGIDSLVCHDTTTYVPLKNDITHQLAKIDELIAKYVDVVSNFQVEEDEKNRLRQELTNRRQYFSFLEKLKGMLDELFLEGNQVQKAMIQQVKDIKVIVEKRDSVPKSTIYPLFIELSEKWLNSKSISIQLRKAEYIYKELLSHKDTYEPTLNKASTNKKIEKELSQQDDEPQDYDGQTKPQRVQPSKDMTVEFSGFDPYKLVTGTKILRPASDQVQYVNYEQKYYAFDSEESAKQFFNNPQKYLQLIKEQIQQEPDLIHLLNLEDSLPQEVVIPSEKHKKEMVSMSVQTVSGNPVKSFIDPKYEWSEWKLRERALKIADLRTKRTNSTQTKNSHFRRDGTTQVDSKPNQPVGTRSRKTNTRKEQGTNPVKHVRYMKGLRQPGKKFKVVHYSFEYD